MPDENEGFMSDELPAWRYLSPADGPVTFSLPGYTAVRIDPVGRIIAVDGRNSLPEEPDPSQPEWVVRDLRHGTYGGFHQLRPAGECMDADCIRRGEHGQPADAGVPPRPDGEYARVEIMGHDSHAGWVTDGTRAGVPVMVIRDWDNRVIAEVPGQSLYRFVPLPTPLKRPEPQRAIAAGAWDDDDEGPF